MSGSETEYNTPNINDLTCIHGRPTPASSISDTHEGKKRPHYPDHARSNSTNKPLNLATTAHEACFPQLVPSDGRVDKFRSQANAMQNRPSLLRSI